MPPSLVIPRGLSTLYRAHTISSNHWVKSLSGLPGAKGLIAAYIRRNPCLIRTLIEYAIFAHSAPGWTRTRTINTQMIHSPRPNRLN